MNYTARISRLSKEVGKNRKRPVRIKVAKYKGEDKDRLKKCDLYYAKRRLNLLEPDSPKIIYCGLTEEQEERYASLTVEEATKIIKESGNEAEIKG